MGAGCSSPLRRLGKKGKSRRDSSLAEHENDDVRGQLGSASGGKTDQPRGLLDHQKSLLLENEITIQSEINEDHPSTASYYTDGKNHNEETKLSEQSTGNDPKTTNGAQNGSGGAVAPANLSLVAKMKGLNGSYMPHDRHLLVSPAISPAPSSTCYSPSPASSTPGYANAIDLNDLNEAFKTIAFGSPDQPNQRIKQERQTQSELHNLYTQHLVQTPTDLTNYISVLFITTDTLQYNPTSTVNSANQSEDYYQQLNNPNLDILTNTIESNLKAFCDEHLINLRFLNLSHGHLHEHFHANNLLDTTMKILENEYQENSQRLILIVLSNTINNGNGNPLETAATTTTSSGETPIHFLDKRQLPTKMDAQLMHKLQSLDTSKLEQKDKDLLKVWYNQVGNTFYLNPIYINYPTILSESKEERDLAWKNWLDESGKLIKALQDILDTEPDLSELKLKTLFGSYIEFIMKEATLQKRTLLIRNYSHQLSGAINNQPQNTPPISLSQIRDGSLNDLARLLADSNKLSIKRLVGEDEFVKTVNDWVSENFNKFVDSILENRIVNGKHVPPFVDRKLFNELSCQRHVLEHYLDNITESFETKCQSFYTNQISPLLKGFADSNITQNTDNDLSNELKSIQLSTSHLVFISGPKGCGKSTLFAQLIRMTIQNLLNNAQIIYRFCGISLDSLSPNRLLRSICEQFCQTQGENIAAASYIYSARKLIIGALNKIIRSQSSIIFLDGLDIYDSSDESDLDWFCEIEANPRIKIFITLETDSKLYKKVLGTYSDATYISLDNPSVAEWAQMLTSTARSRRFNSAGNLYDEIKKMEIPEQNAHQLTYSDFSNIIHMCRIRQLNNEAVYPELNPKSIQNALFQSFKSVEQMLLLHLQYLIVPHQLCVLIIILSSSRNGLSESEIISIMNYISSSSSSKTSTKAPEPKLSMTLFNYVKLQLQPWLIEIVSDLSIKVSIKKSFATKAIAHYISTLNPNIETETREKLLEYFSRPIRPRTSKGNILKGDTQAELKENLGPAERSLLATQASETTNLLILMNPSKAKDHMLSKSNFFQQFLYGSMPEEYVEDYDKLREVINKKPSGTEELQFIVKCIRQSIYPLRYDGIQIYSQIYCRSYETIKSGRYSKSKKLNEIMNVASCPPLRNLLPISEVSVNSFIKTRIGQTATNASPSTLNTPSTNNPPRVSSKSPSNSNPQSMAGQAVMKQRMYTIKDNHRHIIVIYPDKGTLSVWDIYEERAVRTISNLDQPRDLKMIDHKRAVILCNRELRVYDLDSGALLTKLKGVMNQKMPFFEVFGDNYVVALARNRMYVNMLNLNTGELETTFKVGEDRFLNSLLVSANGGICVCGDETQKPFPLLVWNLNERRLLYDLRLDRHEFITRMSAISDDGHFVVSVCKQLGDSNGSSHGSNNNNNNGSNLSETHKVSPNFIVIYDLSSGTLFKKWKPGLDSCAVAISLSGNRSGKVINTISDSSILVWDLATGSKRHTLLGHTAPADVIKVQNERLFSMDSTCRDQSLRIWDIEEGYCLSVFSSDAPVSCCQMSIRGDALVCAFAAETRLSTLVMCKNETVSDVVKRNKRRKSSKSLYIFDEPPSRKSSS